MPKLHILKDWRSLTAPGGLNSLPEPEVLELLEHEKANGRRYDVLLRLHQRYCTLRTARERAEILALAEAL